jgi:hypothetical protein
MLQEITLFAKDLPVYISAADTTRISKHPFPPSFPAEMAIPEWTIGDFVHRGPWWKNRGKHAALPC